MKTRSFALALRACVALGAFLTLTLVAPSAHAQVATVPVRTTPLKSNAPPQVRETATFRAGGGITMWLRATDAGTVLVYAARGIRNPFTRPSVLSAEDTERWAEIAASLVAAADGGGPMPVLRPRPSGGAGGSAVLGGGDLVIDIASPATSPAVALRIGASGSPALSTTLSAALLHDVVPALRETARLAREMAAARLAAHGIGHAAPISRAPAPAGRSFGDPVARGPSVVRPLGSALPTPSASVSQAPLAMTPASRGGGGLVARPDLRLVAVAPESPAFPPAAIVRADTRPSPSESPAVREAAPAVSTGAALTTTVGRLSASAIGDFARRHQPLLAYCYTHHGLSADSTLSGRVSMRVALSPDGDVMHADIANRHWWGRGGDGVESCAQQRVSLWRFPPAPHAGTYEFEVYFGK